MKKILISILSVTIIGCTTSSNSVKAPRLEMSGNVKENSYYTCPMHPEIHESKPGNCPKCGMRLIEENNKNGTINNAMQLQSMDPKLKTSFVCMMNNKHFGVEQIPVDVDGKTYYGCCQGCVASLKNNRSIRYAQDPYSGEDVDKADAYIVLNPDNPQAVLYFKSAENYSKYIEKNSSSK